ncbi:MAG: BatA domain-containing protein [Planctomycetota bacterium]|nr:BatA domain-containing protein [Planctomycetota bacterium]
MTFTLPALLPGLAAAAAPVVIYLILRRRKTEVPWGASYLLRLTLASRRKSSLWKQIVVLTVRTLILLLAALLIAQPFRENPASRLRSPRLPDAPVHRVLLLDDSASMNIASGGGGTSGVASGANSGGDTRLDRLKAAARPLLGTLRPGDRATLLCLTAPATPAVTLDAPIAQPAVASALAAVQPHESPLDLERGLAAALVALRSTPLSAGEVYLLSDFPRDLAFDSVRLASLARRAADAGARLTPVNLAAGEETAPRNVVIHSLDLGVDTAFVGLPLYVYADVACLSDKPLAANFEATVDGRPAARATVELQPNERRRVPLSITFDKPGPAVLRVAADAGGAPPGANAGGTRDLALAVRDKLHLWIVGEEPRENDLDPLGDAAFLSRAIAAAKSDFLVVERRTVNDILLPIPDDVDVIVVAGPRFPRPAMALSLAALARRGGGVVMAVTADLEIDAANEDLASLLPAPLDRPAFDGADPESFVSIRPEPEPGSSAVFAEFAASAASIADNNPLARAGVDGGADLAQARVYNYQRLAAPAPSASPTNARVVFRLSDDQPLLLHRRLGRGNVYFLTTTLGVNWNSLAVRQAYIPFFLRIVQAAAAGREPAHDFDPGQRIVFPWRAGTPARLITPAGQSLPADVASAGPAAFALFDAPTMRGLYRLTPGDATATAPAPSAATAPASAPAVDASAQRLTIRGPVPEADPRTLDAPQSRALAQALNAPIHAGWREAVLALGPDDAAFPLWPWLLAGILGLYLFEAWFVRLL